MTTRPQARLQHCMHCRGYSYVRAPVYSRFLSMQACFSKLWGIHYMCIYCNDNMSSGSLHPHFSFISLSPLLFSLCLSFSVCLCFSICLPACRSVSLVFSICLIFFVVVVVFSSLMLSLPFPSALCKLPKMFCVLFFKLYFFASAVCHCYPSHFRCTQCLFLYVLLLLLLWILCLFISLFDCFTVNVLVVSSTVATADTWVGLCANIFNVER